MTELEYLPPYRSAAVLGSAIRTAAYPHSSHLLTARLLHSSPGYDALTSASAPQTHSLTVNLPLAIALFLLHWGVLFSFSFKFSNLFFLIHHSRVQFSIQDPCTFPTTADV